MDTFYTSGQYSKAFLAGNLQSPNFFIEFSKNGRYKSNQHFCNMLLLENYNCCFVQAEGSEQTFFNLW